MDDEQDEPLDEESPEPEQPAWPGAKPKQAAFLSALVFYSGQHGKAAKAAKIARQQHYQWLYTDEHYRSLHDRAMAQVTQVLEDEAIRRAKEGTKKIVYYMGEECGRETVYSDGLLMMLLKGANPEKYSEKREVKAQVDVSHKFSGTMEELLATYRKLTTEGPAE
jgi:hypothetical protein